MLSGRASGSLSVRPSVVPPSVHTYFVRCNTSLLSGGISMKLATNIHCVSGNCPKGFQSQRSNVRVVYIQICECFDGSIHFNGVMLRRTFFGVFWHFLNRDWFICPAVKSYLTYSLLIVVSSVVSSSAVDCRERLVTKVTCYTIMCQVQ